MARRLTRASMKTALDALAAADPDLARIREAIGDPPLRTRSGGFPALLQVIVEQQLSVASARAIWNRIEGALGAVTPEAYLALDAEGARALGMSRGKHVYACGLAEAIAGGRLDLARIHRMEDEDAIAALIELKGIGRWTAEIYLLSAMARPDVWPVDDLAIQAAAGHAKGLKIRPDRKELLAMGEAWRPWRAVAARLLWHHFRHTVSSRPIPYIAAEQ
jgi:DNA-3-methyladenine glycosylase II